MVTKSIKNIYWQISVVFLAFLACIWGAVAYQMHQARQDALAAAAKEMDNLARVVCAHFASHIASLDAVLQTLRRERSTHGARFPERFEAASELLKGHAPAWMRVADAHGRLQHQYPSTAPPIRLDPQSNGRSVFVGGGDKLYLSASHADSEPGEVFITLTRPLQKDGRFAGTISLSIAAGGLISLYDTLNLGTAGVIAIRQPDGTALIRSKRIELAPVKRIEFQPGGGHFVGRSAVDQTERLFSYRSIGDLGLFVVVGYATDDAMASYNRQSRALVWAGSLCSAAVLLLALVLFRSLARTQRVVRMLSESEARFRSLASLSENWYWEQDGNLRFTAFEGQGMPFPDSLGKTYDELPVVFAETDRRAYSAAVEAHESFRDIEYEVKQSDGTTQYYSICGLPVLDSENRLIGYRGTGRSITDRKAGEARLIFLSRNDSLTGLPNRTLMEDRLAQAIAHADRTNGLVAVLFLDLDHFKRVNDSLGHHVGDELLKGVGQRLLRIVRKSDTVCRLGGDEFIVLLPEVGNVQDIAHVAKKVIATVAEPHEIDKNQLYVTCSVGIAVHPMDGKTRQDLLKNADAALYHAKQHGRNNFQFFTSEINARLSDRLLVENDLRHALENREFRLHYQRKIAAYSGELTGVEALIRWQHPTRGLLHPSAFISVAEECGLIPRIGEWVLNEACAQNKRWQDRGLFHVPMAVNVSSLQFGQRSFLDSLDHALRESTLAPEFLELELTESAVMKDGEESIALLHRLKDTGVQLTIDDFGTAYSSLNYLKRFPIDKVKIDRSFISDIESDQIDFAIVGAIVTLAHSMGLKVVAEGVETAKQRDLVTAHWCDEMQGYLFGMPAEAGEFEQDLLSADTVK